MAHSTPLTQVPPTPEIPRPSFRSSAVARMAGMPVATLRIWEQRYRAVEPSTAASGHRLYSAADVERVTLLRRLTLQGHAIGRLAALDMAQLRALTPPDAAAQRPPMRVVVVGQAMAHRLERLSARPLPARALQTVACFDSLAAALQAARHGGGAKADLLLWQAGGVQTGMVPELLAVQHAWSAPALAVAYRYASALARAELVGAGAVVAQEPADDALLGQWLAFLDPATTPARVDHEKAKSGVDMESVVPDPAVLSDAQISPPRFTEDVLTQFAGLTSDIACECPRHLAELILQISNFESYSGDCASRSLADAQLHAYLQRVAGTARMLLETALARVAEAEGMPLPATGAD